MQFLLYIGDWTREGHGKKETILIESNKPINEVREAYFNAKKSLPNLCPEKYCTEYQDAAITDEILSGLLSAGCPVVLESKKYVTVNSFIDIMLWYISQGDSELTLSRVDTFHFTGEDNKGRNIPSLGYGLFFG